MARNDNKYTSLRLGWDSFTDKLVGKLSKNNLMGVDLSSKEFSDDMYDFLSTNKFDSKGVDYVWKSVKIANPKLTKAQFLKKYIHQPTGNILDTIDNNATSKRVVKRLQKDLGALQGRVARLDKYGERVTQSTVNNSIKDVKRILNTNKTTETHIRKQINAKSRVLARKGLATSEKRDLRRDIKDLKKQLKVTQSSNKKMSNTLSKFTKNYNSYDDTTLGKEYRKVLDNIKGDITKNQQRVVIDQTMRSSASYQTKRTAQTEYIKNVTAEERVLLDDEQNTLNDNEMLLVKWTLSSDHNVIDICDDYAKNDIGYGNGVYPLDTAPIPIANTHPNCKCRVVSHKATNKSTKDVAKSKKEVSDIYTTNFPSKDK